MNKINELPCAFDTLYKWMYDDRKAGKMSILRFWWYLLIWSDFRAYVKNYNREGN